jgi:hypothetical protein
MKRGVKKSVIFLSAVLLFVSVSAHRGSEYKSRANTNLNITITHTLKSSVALNTLSGLSYRGSQFHRSYSSSIGQINCQLVKYQKGNITYIIPYRQ